MAIKTRLLENNKVERRTVTRLALRQQDHYSVCFDALSVCTFMKDAWSGDADMVNFADLAREGEELPGTLQIDVLSDSVFRIRFSEGESVPENSTEMVCGGYEGPRSCRMLTHEDFTEIRTAEVVVTLRHNPYRITVKNLNGRMICGIGGPEKNQFCRWDAYSTGVSKTLDDGTSLATEAFDLAPDECIYGLGEKFHRLNKVGQTLDLINEDGMGTLSERTYKNIPFYVSNKGYGVYFNHHSLMTFWVGSQSGSDLSVGIEDSFLDYYLFCGPIKDVLGRYTDLTGKAVMPPKWSFGFWQSKFTYHSAEETLGIARKMRELEIPCDVLHLDTDWFKTDWHCDLEFDPVDFPDPEAYMSEMASMGIKISLWHMPYIREPSQLFDDLNAVDGFVKDHNGKILPFEACGEGDGVVGVIDFTHPEAVRVYKEYLKKVLHTGARCLKTDFGESVPLDGVYANGLAGVHNRNLYALLYNKAAFEVTEEVCGEGEGLVWARSGWAGSQRYPIHWGGDIAPNHFALGPQLAGGLSFGLSGCPFWSHDIGGFLGENPDMELIVRWFQFGMFNSHSRTHGCGDREIYRYEKRYFERCHELLQMRYRLLPYIWGASQRSVDSSVPVMRAMVIDFQEDPNTWNLADQYMFGPSFLVAPVFDPDHRRNVYLPEGTWTDWFTGEQHPGGRWLKLENIPLERFPLYVKAGSIIPTQPVMNYVGEKVVNEITLCLTPFDQEGETTFPCHVNEEVIPLIYRCIQGAHQVVIGKETGVRFRIQMLGDDTQVTFS